MLKKYTCLKKVSKKGMTPLVLFLILFLLLYDDFHQSNKIYNLINKSNNIKDKICIPSIG